MDDFIFCFNRLRRFIPELLSIFRVSRCQLYSRLPRQLIGLDDPGLQLADCQPQVSVISRYFIEDFVDKFVSITNQLENMPVVIAVDPEGYPTDLLSQHVR